MLPPISFTWGPYCDGLFVRFRCGPPGCLPPGLIGLLYPRTFSTDLDNLICESQGGEKGKLDANGGRRSSIPRVQQISIIGLLTKHNDLKYLPARLCLLSPSMAAIAF